MDGAHTTKRETNPRQNSNIFSKITFLYALPLLLKGYKKELEEDDLYEVVPEYKSQKLGDQIEQEWDKLKFKKKGRVFLLLWNSFGRYYILLGVTKLIVTLLLNGLRPLIIGKFVSYFVPGQTEITKKDAYLYCTILIGLNIVDTLYRQNYQMLMESLAIKCRIAVGSLLFRKALNISVKDTHSIPFGKIANFITRDVNFLDLFFLIFNDAWTGLIAGVVVCYQMYTRIDSAVLVVVVAFAVLLPCLVAIGIKTTVYKTATSAKTDERISIFEELISKIRSSKMYVWEKYVEERIAEARRKEMDIAFKMSLLVILSLVISMLIQQVAYYLLLMTCIWLGQALTSETMYFIASGYQSMSYAFVTAVPYCSTFTAQLLAAVRRFSSILEQLDVENENIQPPEDRSANPRIEAKNLTLQLDGRMLLTDVNFSIDKGLTLIVGHTSCGKSTLLLTVLREFEATGGSLTTEGTISYVSQEPWLFPSTIKQNILFGAEYDEQRYQQVIRACALDYDFSFFEKGDDTIVAGQGNNLSKGQQSRICLARAVYRDCDIYLIDDCLTNLDPLVCNVVIQKCIDEFLKDKLVLLLTSNFNLLQYAQNIVKLDNGRAQFIKNKSARADFTEFMSNEDKATNFEQYELEESEIDTKTKLLSEKFQTNKIYAEAKKAGSVSRQTYKRYINIGGGNHFVIGIFFVFVLGQFLFSYKDKLVSNWTNLEEQIANYSQNSQNSPHYEELMAERTAIFYIYTAVTLGIVTVVMLRGSLVYFFTKKASVSLHKKMLNSVINAPTQFFDITFMGNIVNRFSKDLVVVDETLPFIVLHLTSILFETVGSLVLIAFVNPKYLIPTAVLFAASILLRRGYLKTGTALKRLEATTKSPIVGYLNATLKGLPTIKAFRAENTLKAEFGKNQDLYSSASYCNLSCVKAFVFAVDGLSSLFTSLLILKFLIFSEEVSPGDVGLTVVQGYMISFILYWGFHKWADLETLMTSAERAFEYTDIKKESKTGVALKEWPKRGAIQFENVFLLLNNSKTHILKNLNFTIRPKEKIGIVGRSGAGKSSIISCLFRLYETQGNIIIDGNNIKTLSLDFLRSSLSVIPQDPLLLNGTIRYNLDPQDKYDDEEIWKVMEKLTLKQHFPTLDVKVTESQITFGQRQLICLARALLSKNQILVLDEITENGDLHTESLIYHLIDKHFAMCTIIKITHKMKFVIDCDKVLVIDKGEIVEYDSPRNLLNDENTLFYKMVKKSGVI